jgi:NADPH:quinone reductase
MASNNAVILKKAHRFGPIKEGETLEFVKKPYDLPEPEEGGIVVKALWLSIDPYLRGRIREPGVHSYSPEFQEGKPIDSQGVGEIVKSKNAKFKEGVIVNGMLDWAQYTLLKSPECGWIEEVDTSVPLSAYTGILGMPGFTAYRYLNIKG